MDLEGNKGFRGTAGLSTAESRWGPVPRKAKEQLWKHVGNVHAGTVARADGVTRDRGKGGGPGRTPYNPPRDQRAHQERATLPGGQGGKHEIEAATPAVWTELLVLGWENMVLSTPLSYCRFSLNCK